MSNVNQVQGAAYASPIAETQSAAAPANQESWFGSALSQAAVQAAVEAPVLTPSVAQGLMYRSMTTGVPNAEMEQYGGYGAVKAMFDAGGGAIAWTLYRHPSVSNLLSKLRAAVWGTCRCWPVNTCPCFRQQCMRWLATA